MNSIQWTLPYTDTAIHTVLGDDYREPIGNKSKYIDVGGERGTAGAGMGEDKNEKLFFLK